MLPTFLITLREVIEASLIVATILGMLVKLKQYESLKTVWVAAASALLTSFALVFGGSLYGVRIQKLYTTNIEGLLFILSACFITWAVFFLHTHFGKKKMHFLETLKDSVTGRGLFMLTFTAVLREGIEIALFLSTIYLTNTPLAVVTGFAGGVAAGILISFAFFTASIRLPVFWAFRGTSILLILLAGRLLAQGVGEFRVNTIQTLPALTALTYIFVMHRWVFVRSR
jgi:high-affinity iron transporter